MKLFSVVALMALLGLGCQSARPSRPVPPAAGSLTLLRPGVWLHTSYRDVGGFGRVLSHGLVVASGGAALLVNTPWGADPEADTEAVLRAAAQTTGVAVSRAVVTHHHDDSVAGIAALRRAAIPTYATALTADLMANEGWGRPDGRLAPTPGNAWTLRYGDQTVEVFYPGPGHTADNVVVFVPAARVLFGGCLIRPGESESLGNTADADLAAWDASVARVRGRYAGRVDVVVPTHGAPGGPALLDHTIRLVETHRRRTPGG